jgi:hypothetical protein
MNEQLFSLKFDILPIIAAIINSGPLKIDVDH